MARRRLKAIDALRLAIQREREAVKFYREAAARVEDGGGQTVLSWLAREERRHLTRLRQQLNSLLQSSKWLEWTRAFAPVTNSELSSPSEALGTFGKESSDMEVLRQAIESERASVGFYRDAEERTPDVGGKSMFHLLAEEEEGHVLLLEEELVWVNRYRRYFTLDRFAS